jgi:hypothetical protein
VNGEHLLGGGPLARVGAAGERGGELDRPGARGAGVEASPAVTGRGGSGRADITLLTLV